MVSEMIDYINTLDIYYQINDNTFYIKFNRNTNSILFKTIITYYTYTNEIIFFIPNFPSRFYGVNEDELNKVNNYIKKKYINI